MIKKAINLKETSFTQAINISAQWCNEWGEDLLSEEVLADRVAELIKTKTNAITTKTGSIPSFFLSMRITK